MRHMPEEYVHVHVVACCICCVQKSALTKRTHGVVETIESSQNMVHIMYSAEYMNLGAILLNPRFLLFEVMKVGRYLEYSTSEAIEVISNCIAH